MKHTGLSLLIILAFAISVFSQDVVVEGYAFEDGNRGYLNQVNVNVYSASTDEFILNSRSNQDGFFTFKVPAGSEYRLVASKDIFEEKTLTFKTEEDGKVFLKVPMVREDGYLFEVTLAPKRDSEDEVVDAITGALIEVYNNTTEEEVLVLEDHPSPDFKIHFKKGNHYTVMVRKPGYLVKRMEAFVNVEGCILCFEGVGEVRPGVSDNLTEGMKMGTLLANVEMVPIYEGKVIELENVYYEFGKSELTKQGKENLKNLGKIMEDNPQLKVELGSHTDVRGTGPDNRALSEKRAQSAVDYLTKEMGVTASRIIAKGYGESQIKNKCLPGVTCTEEEHAENRRTEIKILDLTESGLPLKSLSAMKVEENFMRKILEGEGVEQVSYKEKEAEEEVEDAQMVVSKEEKVEVAEEVISEIEPDENMKEKSDAETKMDEKPEKKVVNKEVIKPKLEKQAERKVQEKMEVERKLEKQVEKKAASKEVVVEVEKQVDEGVARDRSEKIDEIIKKKREKTESDQYSGYRIVVHYSNVPISGDHEIYSVFEDIESYRTPQKNMLYMVGSFEDQESAELYRLENISAEYPNSYVVGFIDGLRIKIEE